MIFLLEIDNSKKKGLLSRLFSRSMSVSCTQQSEGALCKISVKSEKSIDWLRIDSMLGEGDFIIAQRIISVPKEADLPIPSGEKAMRRLLLDGALLTVSCAHEKGARLNLLLIDKDASFAKSAMEFIPVCEQLSVLTEQTQAYSAYAQAALAEHGAAPLILESAYYADGCDIIIAPCGISGCGALPLPKMIFAPSGSDCVGVCEKCVQLPELFRSVEVKEYDRFSLAEAIFECDDFLGAAPIPLCMKWRDKILSAEELAGVFYA